MFLAIRKSDLASLPVLHRSMFTDRARQFVARHGWPLRVDEAGLEIDEYDDRLATYCALTDDGRHVASVRLRPAAAGSMVEHHFPDLWLESLRQGVEITRFCASPAMNAVSRSIGVPELLLGLCRHCQRSDIRSLFGVVFPSVAKVIRHAGWAGVELARTQRREGAVVLMEWVPSELVAWRIQEQLEVREARHAQRPTAAVPLAA